MSKIKEYITPREAAEIIGCTSATVRNYAKRGKVECNKVNGRYYIKRSAIGKLQDMFEQDDVPAGYITVKEAARRLKIVPATVHALIGNGRLQCKVSNHKSGGGYTRWVVDNVPDFSRWISRSEYSRYYGVSNDCVLLQAAKRGFEIKSFAGYIYLRKASDNENNITPQSL